MDTIQTFKAARKVATPLLAIRTPDPAATMRGIADSFNGNAPPMVIWDAAAGLRQYNAAGAAELKKAGAPDPMMTTAFPEALKVAEALGQKTIVWLVNGHRVLEDLSCLQALWNLRDSFKTSRRQAVLVGVACILPPELAQDVLILDEPLPSIEQLEAIVTGTLTAGGIEGTTPEVTTKAVDALLGLAAFPAEQATALSLTQQGVDLERLWERKRLMVEQTPGLSVWRGRERFDDLGGLRNIKGFLRDVAAGELPPRTVLFVDEIEKAMAGAQGDTSGVSQALHGAILSWMQDSGATGIMLLGPPGSGKSAVAKAFGNEAGIPTILCDLGGMKGSLVGQSEGNIRTALKVADAVGQGRVLVIATCNAIASLSPELRRRFTFGTFFVDLPDAEERDAIWQLYCRKYNVSGERPDDRGWTGAEIRQCADLAYRLRRPLTHAARFIVPVATSAAATIRRLRTEASGCYISASRDGVYTYDGPGTTDGGAVVGVIVSSPAARAIDLSDEAKN
jgi:hypothetical protein